MAAGVSAWGRANGVLALLAALAIVAADPADLAGQAGRWAVLFVLVAGTAAVWAPVVAESGIRVALAALAALAVLGSAVAVCSHVWGWPLGRLELASSGHPGGPVPGVGVLPFALPLLWWLVVGGWHRAVGAVVSVAWTPIVVALLAAATSALLDVPAVQVGLWCWSDSTWPWGGPLLGGAPYVSLAGWAAVALVSSIGLQVLGVRGARLAREPALAVLLLLALGGVVALSNLR